MENIKTTLFILDGGKTTFHTDSNFFGDNFYEELKNSLEDIQRFNKNGEEDEEIKRMKTFIDLLDERKKQKNQDFYYDNSHIESLFIENCILEKTFHDNLKINDQFSAMCFTALNSIGEELLYFLEGFNVCFNLKRIYWKSKTENTLYLIPFHIDFALDDVF